MKEQKKINRTYEYIPDVLAERIENLANNSKGYSNTRFNNYLKIVGTIFYKCIDKNYYAHIPVLLRKNYWLKVVGGRYNEYINELIEAGIIQKYKKNGGQYYSIEVNITLLPSTIKLVYYRNQKEQNKTNNDIEKSPKQNYEKIENRLGKRIIANLNKVTVDYELFVKSVRNGHLDINPNDYEIDISKFPPQMDFKAVVHYVNDVSRHNYKVKTLLEKAKELNHKIYYDNDRILVINEDQFKMLKTHTSIVHAELNLSKFVNQNYELSRDEKKTRRVFHVGVSLPSKTLKFLKINGEPIVGIDAKTSQFLLIANILNSFTKAKDSIADNFKGKRKKFIKDLYKSFVYVNNSHNSINDINKFYTDVIENDFYEVLKNELNLDYRNQAKIFAFLIIFSKPETKNEFKNKIKDRYPTVIKILDHFKMKNGYKQLAINLQAVESEIFIDGIFNSLNKKNIICFTRHDSVIVSSKDQNIAYSIAIDYYKKLNLEPKFKIEKYSSPSKKYTIEYEYSYPPKLEFLQDVYDINDIIDLNTDQLEILKDYADITLTGEIFNNFLNLTGDPYLQYVEIPELNLYYLFISIKLKQLINNNELNIF